MLPKKGMEFPRVIIMVISKSEHLGPYPAAIACALRKQLGTTHQAVKIVMRWTGAGERTVKNWLTGASGPSGQHLVDLMRHSDNVLEILLLLAGRRKVTASMKLADLRDKLAGMVQHIDELMDDVGRAQ
jgi:hypothetical protein